MFCGGYTIGCGGYTLYFGGYTIPLAVVPIHIVTLESIRQDKMKKAAIINFANGFICAGKLLGNQHIMSGY